jgi:hypothetical protein
MAGWQDGSDSTLRNGINTPEAACLFLAESSANISHRFLQRAQRAQRLTARLTAL